MAGVVQWGIDQLWSELQRLEDLATGLKRDLVANKNELTHLWTMSRAIPDPKAMKRAQDKLRPLIHQNSVIRTQYVAPIVQKFNAAVALAGQKLKAAGYTTPTLSGLGFAFVIAPAAAVVLVITALSLVYIANRLTQANITATQNVHDMIAAGFTPAQIEDISRRTPTKPLGFDFGDLMPIALLVAAVFIVPPLLKTLPKRGAA